MAFLNGNEQKIDRMTAEDSPVPGAIVYPMEALAWCTVGGAVELDGGGYAEAAGSSAAGRTVGVCLRTVQNSGFVAGAVSVEVDQGAYYFDNAAPGADAITQAYVELPCYWIDDHTVANNSAVGTRPYAGIVKGIRYDGKIGVQMPLDQSAGLDFAAQRYYARGVADTNVAALAAFVVAAFDGITYVQGDTVCLIGQAAPLENGPYIVGLVAGPVAPLTRPSWWGTGAPIPQGTIIELGGEGTFYGGATLKAMCAKGQVVDTNDPLFYPQIIKGQKAAAAGGTATVTGLCITTTAQAVASDLTTPGSVITMVPTVTPGASATGSLAVAGTAGAGGDVVSYIITNW